MHDTFYLVIGQRWLWLAASMAAMVSAATSMALRRLVGGVGRWPRLLIASAAAPLLFVAIAGALVLWLSREHVTDWSDLAWAAVVGAGLQAATLGLVFGAPVAILFEWMGRS